MIGGPIVGKGLWKNFPDIRTVCKSANQAVTNSTVLVDDNELYFAVGANEVWHFYMCIYHNAPAAADIKFAWTVPAAGEMRWISCDLIGTMAANAAIAFGAAASTRRSDGAAADRAYIYWCTYIGGANAGTVQLQWAQNTADAVASYVLANSLLIAFRVS